ncbi:MAG TPA: hypothetical protein VHO90_09965, partial [Bacteroidales bacterium]|nr:hypothetical protein [Bacteroidales bacterium]
FIGYFSDWRTGMDAYARANALISSRREWNSGTPFGWNSWGKIQTGLTYEKAIQVSDFFAEKLQPASFQNNGIVYIGLDSWWDKLSDDQLKLFADHCKANHQEAGIYWAPFTQWGTNDNATVQGSDYKYSDIYLYANGKKQYLDGATAIDPTHPATKRRIDFFIQRFRKAGFRYIKIDFLTHGAFEADRYYNPQITTGIQAYNEGMKYLTAALGDSIFITQAISPLFPGNYAHARRIACDSWGSAGQSEYTMNALTYGWWLSNIYRFNDADHIVLNDFTEGENRIRVTSSVITGIYILGDDFSEAGGATGKQRAEKFVTNNNINAIAKIGRSFYPAEGNTGNESSTVFTLADGDTCYIAAFNFGNVSKKFDLDLERLFPGIKGEIIARELWSGKTIKAAGILNAEVPSNDAAVFRITSM